MDDKFKPEIPSWVRQQWEEFGLQYEEDVRLFSKVLNALPDVDEFAKFRELCLRSQTDRELLDRLFDRSRTAAEHRERRAQCGNVEWQLRLSRSGRRCS